MKEILTADEKTYLKAVIKPFVEEDIEMYRNDGKIIINMCEKARIKDTIIIPISQRIGTPQYGRWEDGKLYSPKELGLEK